jgi:hypothetical protein
MCYGKMHFQLNSLPSRAANFEEAQRALEQCKILIDRVAATMSLGLQSIEKEEDGKL